MCCVGVTNDEVTEACQSHHMCCCGFNGEIDGTVHATSTVFGSNWIHNSN